MQSRDDEPESPAPMVSGWHPVDPATAESLRRIRGSMPAPPAAEFVPPPRRDRPPCACKSPDALRCHAYRHRLDVMKQDIDDERCDCGCHRADEGGRTAWDDEPPLTPSPRG